jgi:hypothetical protein
VERDGRQLVYLIEGDRVREVVLQQMGTAGSGDLLPLADRQLAAGQRLVIRPSGLKDGQRVKVVSP